MSWSARWRRTSRPVRSAGGVVDGGVRHPPDHAAAARLASGQPAHDEDVPDPGNGTVGERSGDDVTCAALAAHPSGVLVDDVLDERGDVPGRVGHLVQQRRDVRRSRDGEPLPEGRQPVGGPVVVVLGERVSEGGAAAEHVMLLLGCDDDALRAGVECAPRPRPIVPDSHHFARLVQSSPAVSADGPRLLLPRARTARSVRERTRRGRGLQQVRRPGVPGSLDRARPARGRVALDARRRDGRAGRHHAARAGDDGGASRARSRVRVGRLARGRTADPARRRVRRGGRERAGPRGRARPRRRPGGGRRVRDRLHRRRGRPHRRRDVRGVGPGAVRLGRRRRARAERWRRAVRARPRGCPRPAGGPPGAPGAHRPLARRDAGSGSGRRRRRRAAVAHRRGAWRPDLVRRAQARAARRRRPGRPARARPGRAGARRHRALARAHARRERPAGGAAPASTCATTTCGCSGRRPVRSCTPRSRRPARS